MLDLFADENPNPSLRLYLELASVAGARFGGVQDITPAAVVAHLATLAKDNEITLASLARASSVGRPLLSTLFNDPDPNPTLATIDRLVTALDAASDFELVPATQAEEAAEAEEAEEADDGEAEDEDDGEAEDDADDDAEEEDADADEADDDDDQAEDDDQTGDDRDAVVAALQEQNTALQRRVEANEAQIAELAKPDFWKKLAKGAAGVAAGAGIAILVLKRRKE